MKKIPKLTPKVLSPLQLTALKEFFKLPLANDFFLTGGTALAGFHLFHRKSVDLDFFSHKKLEQSVLEETVQKIAKKLNLEHKLLHFSEDTFRSVVLTSPTDSVKLDFVADVPVHFGEFENFDEKIKVDSMENIAVNKITAIFGRTDPKDFVDLYFLLKKEGFKLDELIAKAKKKDLGITEFYLAGALSNIQNTTQMPEMLVSLSHKELEKYMLELSNQLFLKIKPKK